MFRFIGLVLCLSAFLFASTPTDRSVDAAYGVVFTSNCSADTITSATDSAVIKKDWVIPAAGKGCLWVMSMPKITGTAADGSGTDSVKAYLAIKGYDKDGNYLFTYTAPDTVIASTAKRIVLPIETPICPADKYTILWYAYTGSGTQVIFSNAKLYALKLFTRQN